MSDYYNGKLCGILNSSLISQCICLCTKFAFVCFFQNEDFDLKFESHELKQDTLSMFQKLKQDTLSMFQKQTVHRGKKKKKFSEKNYSALSNYLSP